MESIHSNVPVDRNLLRDRMIELENTKAELRQAKVDVARSWLQARPLIEELEKLNLNLATTKSRILLSNAIISELEAELQTTENSIWFKTGIESKQRSKATELNQSLERIREEMEELDLRKSRKRQSRKELKQELRLKKQSLKRLQLTLRAVKLESEAIGASTKGAVNSICCSEKDTTTIEISNDEYYDLMKRAKEETSFANWRVSVSIEQKLVAEESRNSALRRFEEMSEDKSRERENKEEKSEGIYPIKDGEKENSRIKSEIDEIEVIDEEMAYPKAKPDLISWSSEDNTIILVRNPRRIKMVPIKKTVLVRMGILIQKVRRWFR